MPVLVELLSLVAPAGTLRTAVDPGHLSFVDDGVLEAVFLRSHDELGQALAALEKERHVPIRDGLPGDVALVDQLRGPSRFACASTAPPVRWWTSSRFRVGGARRTVSARARG